MSPYQRREREWGCGCVRGGRDGNGTPHLQERQTSRRLKHLQTLPMNLRTRISRADGYRQLEMFADACMELEMLEGQDRMADATLHCRWTIYRDSENWLGARSMAAEMARRDPKDSEWRTRNAHAVRMNESAEAALAYLMKERKAFEDDAAHLYEIGRYKCLTGDPKGAKEGH